MAAQTIDLASEFETPKPVDLASEFETPTEAKSRERVASIDSPELGLNAGERFFAKNILAVGGGKTDAAISAGVPIVASVAGGILGGPGGGAAGGGSGSALADTLVQLRQYFRGERDEFSPGEIAASGVVGAVIPKPVKAAGSLANQVLKTAAVRSAQGLGLSAAQEGLTEVFDGDKLDFGKIATQGTIGAVLGAGFGTLEKVAPAAWSFLKGLGKKTPTEAVAAITPAIDNAQTAAEKAALLEVRDRLENAKHVVTVNEPAGPPTESERVQRHNDVLDALRGGTDKAAAESAATLENAQRAQDFDKAQVELAAQQAESNRLAGPENTILGDDPLKNQLTTLETRPGGSTQERARIEGQLQEQTPQVNVEPTAELSSQAQDMYDKYGYIRPRVLTSLAGGAAGAVTGSTQGDTVQDRLVNATLYGVAGLVGGAALGSVLTSRLAGKTFVEQQQILRSEIEKTEDPLIRARLTDVLDNTRPLPDDAKITVMEMAGKRAVQVDIPGGTDSRPIFSGTPEQAQAAGFSGAADIKELPPGTYNYSDLNERQSESTAPIFGEGKETRSSRTVDQGLPGNNAQERGPLWPTRELQKAIGPLPQPVRTLSGTAGGVNPVLARALTSGAGAIAGFGAGFEEHPDEPVERRIVNGLTVAVLGAGGGYALGKSFTRLAENAMPKTTDPELAKWYKRLSDAGAGESLAEKIQNAPNRLRTLFTTSFAPLDKLPAQIAEANGTPIQKLNLPLSKSFELVNGASGKAAVDVEDFGKAVLSQLQPGESKDFNALLAIKRAGQRLQAGVALQAEQARIQAIPAAQRTADEVETLARRPDQKRVAQDTLATVDQSLKALEAKLGTTRFNELDQIAAGSFQQAADKALQLQVASGRMSAEQYGAIKKTNDFYAPYRILEAAEGFDGLKGTRTNPVDTKVAYTQAITGIDSLDFHLADPLQVMQEKIFQGRILAEKNLKMQELARLSDPSGEVIRKLGPGETPPRDKAVVNYFENGEPQQLVVSQDVAESIKGMNTTQSGVIARFAKAVNRPFRFGATGGNIAFQTVNAPADQFRLATTSKYGFGAGGVADVVRYPADFVTSLYASMLGSEGAATAAGAVGGFYAGYQQGDTAEDKFKRGAAGGVAGGLLGAGAKHVLPETQLYRDFYQSGAAGATMQDMINRFSGEKTTLGEEGKRLAGRGVLTTLEDFGKAVEETTKILGFQRGLRIEGIKNASTASADKLAQVVSEVRNFAGSPDFAVAGTVSRDLNAALVFLNPRIQGLSEDAGRLAGRDGAKAASNAWLKLGGATGLAAAYLWYRNNQPENKDDYAQVSPDEKNRYAMIPRYDDKGAPLYFTNDRGQKVRDYYRIPLRDTMQNIYGLTHAAMQFADDKDPSAVAKFGGDLLENLSPINIAGKNTQERMESVVSNLGPLGTVPYMLASERNPGLHQEIYKGVVSAEVMKQGTPENRFNPSTPEIYKQMANVMPQWFADPLRSPVMLSQLTQAVSGGVINQFTPPKPSPDRDPTATALQQSPLGRRFVRSSYVYDPPREDAQAALQTQADQKISGARNVRDLYDQLDSLPPDERAGRFQSLSPEDQKALAAEYKKRQTRPADTEISMVKQMEIGNGSRAQYLYKRLQEQPPEARGAFLKELQDAKALSPTVLKQLNFLQQQSLQPAGAP